MTVYEFSDAAGFPGCEIRKLSSVFSEVLTSNRIHFADGFGHRDGDVRWYEDRFSGVHKVRLIKLHGSISWWSQGGSNTLQPAIITERNPAEWRNHRNQPIKDIRSIPSFLTGVLKVYSYNRGIFADQHFHFLQLLHSGDLMVMSGYGWGDIPLNFQLQNWLSKSERNTLILLHRDPEGLADNSLELRHVYSKYTKSKQIIPLRKWLSETPSPEVTKLFN